MILFGSRSSRQAHSLRAQSMSLVHSQPDEKPSAAFWTPFPYSQFSIKRKFGSIHSSSTSLVMAIIKPALETSKLRTWQRWHFFSSSRYSGFPCMCLKPWVRVMCAIVVVSDVANADAALNVREKAGHYSSCRGRLAYFRQGMQGCAALRTDPSKIIINLGIPATKPQPHHIPDKNGDGYPTNALHKTARCQWYLSPLSLIFNSSPRPAHLTNSLRRQTNPRQSPRIPKNLPLRAPRPPGPRAPQVMERPLL
jgi:hypothetical protein